jgi:hypothetical protein
MDGEDARAKGWNTWRANMLQYAKEHPEFSLYDFIYQRVHGAYLFCAEARNAERRHDYKKARELYLKATESLSQAEKLVEYPAATAYVENLKAEYFDFVVHRDPYYRHYLKYFLPVINAEPGILQTDMYKRFDLPQPEISYTLYFADKEGLIRREKKGRSYQLFFVRDKAADELLLTIQDDEIDKPPTTKNEETSIPESVHVFTPPSPEDKKYGCLAFIMLVLLVISFFIGPLGLITIGIALGVDVYLLRKFFARRKAARARAAQTKTVPSSAIQKEGQADSEKQGETP